MTTHRVPRAVTLVVLLALAMPGGAIAASPVATDDTATITEDALATSIDVLDNDSDEDMDILTISDATDGDHGNVVIAGDAASLTYKPDHDYFGPDVFQYTVSDGTDDATAVVTVTVNAVDDPPVAVDDDDLVVAEDASIQTLDVLANDTDVDGGLKQVMSVTQPDMGTGTSSVAPGGTSVQYVPAANATGPDEFTYTLNGGPTATVNITITGEDDPPIAVGDSFTVTEDAPIQTLSVLANDTDVDGGTKVVASVGEGAKGATSVASAGAGARYTPDENQNGPDAFTYGLNGGSTATVDITITPVNDKPETTDDVLNIPANAIPVNVHALSNDSDVDGDVLKISGTTTPTRGMALIGGGGTILTYQPFPGVSGSDSFDYTVDDGHGETAVGTVNVTITAGNHTPNAVNDVESVPQGAGPMPLTILDNDQDADGNTLTITARTNGAHGTVTITGGGTGLTYNPVNSYHGTDTFTYTISDGLAFDTATVRVTVVRDTVPPIVLAPIERFPGHTVGSFTTKARLTWSAVDAGSGIKAYKLQVSVDGGPWKTIALPRATTKTIDRSLTTGHTYRFRVRARDGEGTVSAYVTGPLLMPSRYSEASTRITYVGAWAKTKTKMALGGATRHATSSAKRARFTFTAYDVGWIATQTTKSGKARIFIDGSLVATIDLDRSKTAYRKLVFARHFTTLATHTLEIQPVGDGRVDIDSLVILR